MDISRPDQSKQRLAAVKSLLQRILPEDAFFFDSSRYPITPGCYLMKDRRGVVIYIGKAKNLRDRLSSYFQARQRDPKIERMVRRVSAVEVILVNNEWESLVLENNLIKFYKPHFNARLKADDSGYFYIIQTAEKYPRLLPYMRNGYSKEIERIQGKAIEKRYGPYLSRRFRDILLEFVVDHHGIRTCSNLPRQACLRYEIRRCSGACELLISLEQYSTRLQEAAVFLSYDKVDVVEHTLSAMKQRMKAHAERLEFESAHRIYEKIEAIEKLRVKQIVERDLPYDQDVVCFDRGCALVMHLLKGAVLWFSMHHLAPSIPANLAQQQFLLQHYGHGGPQELIVNMEEYPPVFARTLNQKRQYPVRILRPDTEETANLMELCKRNLIYRLEDHPAN
jgi:excinuclease ABC subunit C